MIILPIIAVTVSSLLSIMVLKQYATRKKPYQLMWGIGFLMFSVASIAQVIAETGEWNLLLLKIYYLFGATLLVGYLGLGTIFLLWSEKVAKVSMYFVLFVSAVALLLIMQTDLDKEKLQKVNSGVTVSNSIAKDANLDTAGEEDTKLKPTDALKKPGLLRAVALLMNMLGSLALVGGAGYSAINARKKNLPNNIFYGTAILAAGAFIIAGGGTASGIAEVTGQIVLSATIALGIIVMFVGFLFVNKKPTPKQEPS